VTPRLTARGKIQDVVNTAKKIEQLLDDCTTKHLIETYSFIVDDWPRLSCWHPEHVLHCALEHNVHNEPAVVFFFSRVE
jgi:hypothetical protein